MKSCSGLVAPLIVCEGLWEHVVFQCLLAEGWNSPLAESSDQTFWRTKAMARRSGTLRLHNWPRPTPSSRSGTSHPVSKVSTLSFGGHLPCRATLARVGCMDGRCVRPQGKCEMHTNNESTRINGKTLLQYRQFCKDVKGG